MGQANDMLCKYWFLSDLLVFNYYKALMMIKAVQKIWNYMVEAEGVEEKVGGRDGKVVGVWFFSADIYLLLSLSYAF